MRIGFVGLGKMGLNMAQRLIQDGHQIVGFARHESSRAAAAEKGAETADSLAALADKLSTPKIMWLMIPAGEPCEKTVNLLTSFLSKGDIIIDGGNSYYKDSIRRAQFLKDKGIHFLDVGTSGGIWGLKLGYCLMIGGERDIFNRLEPVFKSLAPKDGYAYMGGHGAGHFVKMIHNGIEYAMLQAYAEGFDLMQAKKEYNLDLAKISHLWNQGSVVRSWLLELAENMFNKNADLENIQGYVADSGEGRWTVEEALASNIPAPVITLSLLERFASRRDDSFAAKVLAGLRDEFGGHGVKYER